MYLFNEGDTACLILNYNLNGNPLVQGAYDEIEFQINSQGSFNNIKKLLSKSEISWGSVSYIDSQGHTQTFTGYFTTLTQEETFKLRKGVCHCQLRILMNGEVGSSSISDFDLGDALSTEILE